MRRDAKQVWNKIFFKMRREWVVPDIETYRELSEAFRGGNTHGNRYGIAPEGMEPIVHENVHSYDRSSSYPDVMCNMKFPLGKWSPREGIFDEKVIEKYAKIDRAMVFRVRFTNLRLKNRHWGCPYLSKDKAYNLRKLTYHQMILKEASGELYATIDNGRVIEASELITCITDVDYKIIEYEYSWDTIEIFDLKVCKYSYLPQEFVELIQTYYRNKTELKGVKEKQYLYNESKAKINSLYGMSAQKTIKAPIVFTDNPDNLYDEEQPDEQAQIDASLRKAFLPYSVGVWVTAWARYWLEQAIILIHETEGAMFLYTDTDSVKFTGEVDFSELNSRIKAQSIKTGSFATDPKGKIHYMGIYEDEGTYKRFATMGAKKYMYEDEKGIHLTVAGLVKYDKEGCEISAKEIHSLGDFSAFKSGTTFTQSGGIEAIYNDEKHITTLQIDGHTVEVTRNVCLKPSTYTFGMTDEYIRLLKSLHLGLDKMSVL